MIENNPFIAKNKAEANSTMHHWYISEENEGEIEKAKKREIIEEAVYNLHKLKRESGAYKTYQVGTLLLNAQGRPIMKGKLSDDSVKNRISDYISDPTTAQMDNISKFMELIAMTESVSGIERFTVQYIVQQAINVSVIALRDNKYIWHSKAGEPDVYDLGASFDKMVSLFVSEFKNYNKDSDVTNWYKDLFEEANAKGVWIEN
jgi:hypothetical protein